MRYIFSAIALALVPLADALGVSSHLLTVQKFAGEIKPSSFIVKLKHGTDKAAHLAALQPHLSGSRVTHDYNSDFLNAFAGTFSEDVLNMLRASSDIEYIEEDGIFHTLAITTQTDAPWGLSRLSQDGMVVGSESATNFHYRYNSSAGAGVDIYGVDTGIFTNHSDFGGRARWGATFGPYADADGNGHGTHTAATAVGTRWGVAKAANIIAVKVLSDQGAGAISDIIAGLNFVGASAKSSGRPSIATLSFGGSPSTALDSACTSLLSAGIHITAAAGNGAMDAMNVSPARVAGINTIGAMNISDCRTSSANFGAVVDIYAPGQSVISAWIDSISATRSLSGSSMATPHVAGLIAYFISVNGNASPASLTQELHTFGVDNVLCNIPAGTRNEVARNDIPG